jgi:hypothetical protein
MKFKLNNNASADMTALVTTFKVSWPKLRTAFGKPAESDGYKVSEVERASEKG